MVHSAYEYRMPIRAGYTATSAFLKQGSGGEPHITDVENPIQYSCSPLLQNFQIRFMPVIVSMVDEHFPVFAQPGLFGDLDMRLEVGQTESAFTCGSHARECVSRVARVCSERDISHSGCSAFRSVQHRISKQVISKQDANLA